MFSTTSLPNLPEPPNGNRNSLVLLSITSSSRVLHLALTIEVHLCIPLLHLIAHACIEVLRKVKGEVGACREVSPSFLPLSLARPARRGYFQEEARGGMERGDRSDEEDEDTQSSGPGGGGDDSGGPRETPLLPPRPGGEDGEGSGSEEEGDTSDSGSTNSSTSSSGSSSSSGMAAGSPGEETYSGTLMQTDEFGDHFHVNCAGNAAKFYLNRFARGSIGRCVLFRSRWITPNEFQAISGRQSSKDWKRSIRLRGRCLKEYITQGLFQEHLKTCACRICSGEAAEHLRLEGEMALAAKRRRLSQADGGSAVAGQR